MDKIQQKFEKWCNVQQNIPSAPVCVHEYMEQEFRAYQAAYKQAIDDVVEMLEDYETEKMVGAAIYTREALRLPSAEQALTAIKQKVKEV